jgi:hypothetical protein
VTWDESQVGVGGLLALDQVLRNTLSYLTIFGLRNLVKDGVPGEVDITRSWSTFGPF